MSPRSVVINMVDCDIVKSEFKLQSHHYIHFWTNTFEKSHESPWRNGLSAELWIRCKGV